MPKKIINILITKIELNEYLYNLCKYILIMEHIIKMTRRDGVDVGYVESDLEPLNGVGRVGKSGIDKTFKFERLVELAYEIRANIIIKAGKNAKWYLKRCDLNKIDEKIEKQRWRDTSRVKMWIIEWDN